MSDVSQFVSRPTSKDLGVAIEILKRAGMAGVNEAVFRGGGPETEQLAEAAESVARVVEHLRWMRDGSN